MKISTTRCLRRSLPVNSKEFLQLSTRRPSTFRLDLVTMVKTLLSVNSVFSFVHHLLHVLKRDKFSVCLSKSPRGRGGNMFLGMQSIHVC